MAISSNGSGNSLRLTDLLGNATRDVGKALTRLSSGSRINRAADDAAGLAIASALEAEAVKNRGAVRNANDGISVANIADAALSSSADINARLQELATQAANGTNSDAQRSALDEEFQALKQEQQRQLSSAEFNGQKIFNNSETVLQVGTDSSANSQISLPSVNTSSLVTSGSIASVEAARSALDDLKTKSDTTSSLRSQIGAAVSRIETAQTYSKNSAVENQAAASRIRDADIATEVANLTSARIRQDASTGLAAQSKITAAQVLELLK